MGKGPSCWFEQILINNGNDFITGGRLNEKLVVINSNVSTKTGTEGNGNIDTGAQY